MPTWWVHNDVRSLAIAAAKLQSEKESEYITDERLAKELGWTLEKVRIYQRYSRALANYVEFQRPVKGTDGETSFGDLLPGVVGIEEESLDRLAMEEEAAWLGQATAELPPLARVAVILIDGLPVPAGVPNPAFDDVIKTAMNNSANTSRGIKNLRRIRQDGKGDMPDLGKQNTSVRISGRKSPAVASHEEKQHRAINIWRRRTSEAWFPILSNDKPARAMGSGELRGNGTYTRLLRYHR